MPQDHDNPDVSYVTSGALEGVCHGFFGRHGGVSKGLYDSLNCGYGSDDRAEDVLTNRAVALNALTGRASDMLTVHQIHSADVVVVDDIWLRDNAPRADAMVTRTPRIALGILTADCAPVLFADPDRGVIGAAHAGWKGAFGGVLENTVTAMEGLGAQRADIVAAVGPCIHQASYEVDGGFYERFVDVNPANEAFFVPSPTESRYMFDLPGYVVSRLSGLSIGTISASPADTYPPENGYYSYRRTTHQGEPDYGREVSIIALEG